MNYCRSCSTDFSSVTAFDRHRVGVYEYAWSSDREDGRRCLIGDELSKPGWNSTQEHAGASLLRLRSDPSWQLYVALEAKQSAHNWAASGWGMFDPYGSEGDGEGVPGFIVSWRGGEADFESWRFDKDRPWALHETPVSGDRDGDLTPDPPPQGAELARQRIAAMLEALTEKQRFVLKLY
jgi:hypothetical protein